MRIQLISIAVKMEAIVIVIVIKVRIFSHHSNEDD